MSKSPNSVITPQTPRSAVKLLSTTANANYTAPTNTTIILTAGADGGRLTKLKCIPCASMSNTEIQLFRSNDGGTTKVYVNAVTMGSVTKSQTASPPQTDFGYTDFNPLILGPGEILYLAVGVGGVQINAEAEWADY